MQRDTDFLFAQLADYATGECSPEQAAVVERLLTTDPEAAALLEELRAVMRAVPPRVHLAVVEPIVAGVQGQIARGQTSIRHNGRVSSPSANEHRTAIGRSRRFEFGRHSSRATFLSASAFLLVALGAWRYRAERSESVIASRTYHTEPGQQSTVRLADGSVMTLAPATTVSIAPQGIELVGEAYFAVAPHLTRPFVVRTRNAVVQVLGTQFVLREYPTDRASRIVVEDGKVALHSTRTVATSDQQHEQTVLSARMLAQVTDSGIIVTPGIATGDYTSWTHGTLVFDSVAVGDVVTELARAYDARIRIVDTSLARRPLALEVSVQHQPLTQILDFIGRVTDSHYVFDGNTYYLSLGRSVAPKSSRIQLPPQEKQYGR